MQKRNYIDIFDFERLRNISDALYVDKTKYIYDIVGKKAPGFFFFLSRPRRFGKSLFCSTLEYLFAGRRDLFEGLYIAEKTDYSFEKYPVLHFDFSKINLDSFDSFYSSFKKQIAAQAGLYDVRVQDDAPSTMLDEVISSFKQQVVIIIDEYDAPITSCLTDENARSFISRVQMALKSFFSIIKSNTGRVRFFFMTGITKYSNLSIFSQLNNLIDISFDRNFASAFGYTEAELRLYFSEYIDGYLCVENREYETEEDFISAVRDNYDGYSFSTDMAQRVYNPVSVASFFLNGFEFKNYWNSTGVSSLAVEFARRNNLLSIIDSRISLNEETFTSFEISQFAKGNVLNDSQIYALLYFTGYLTIRGVNRNIYELEFPNKEVARSFSYSLVTKYCEAGFDFSSRQNGILEDASKGKTSVIISNLMRFFDAIPYDLIEGRDRSESTYNMLVHAFFIALDYDATAQDKNRLGKSDEVFFAGNHVYILELKVDGSADDALRQIDEKEYYSKYMKKGNIIHIVGLNFISSRRQIDTHWAEKVIKEK